MIGVHIGMSLLESGVRPDVVSLVTEMRRARAGMVQTDAQYVFIYEALNDHIRQYQAAKKPRRNVSFSSTSLQPPLSHPPARRARSVSSSSVTVNHLLAHKAAAAAAAAEEE